MSPPLSQRSLMLFKIETTNNVENVPSPAADAFLVMNADVKINPNVLTRNFYRNTLSKLPSAVGRKLATFTFTHEVKGSGRAGVTAKLATLMRACGFALTSVADTTSTIIQTARADTFNTSPVVAFAKTTKPTQNFGRYKIKVVLGGASATAMLMVFGSPADAADLTIFPEDVLSATVMGAGKTTTVVVVSTDPLAPTFQIGTPHVGDVVVLNVYGVRFKYTIASTTADDEATAIAALLDLDGRMSATATTDTITAVIDGGSEVVTTAVTGVALGASGGVVTPSWTGSLVLGDSWIVDLLKPGLHATPVSDDFESGTAYMYYDGTLHRMTGCMGNVQFTGQAGNYATAQFSFTGQYNDPDDAPLPTTAVFEKSNPVQVELARLAVGNSRNLRAQSFNIDMGIQIQPRESVSHPDGYDGVLYTSREPKGGVNPEMTLESEEPYWRHMALADLLRFHSRIGTVANNIVEFDSNTIQLSNVAYSDRNTQRVYDLSMGFVLDQFSGDDELRVVFC